MHTTPKYFLASFLVLVVLSPVLANAALRDGKRFDPGVTMTTRATTAPEEIDVIAPLIGQWDVEFEWFQNDSLVHSTTGAAEFTFMNRGHGIMERCHIEDFDGQGHILDTIMFMGYSRQVGDWSIGMVNSFNENVMVFNMGTLAEGNLGVETVIRVGGGSNLTHYKLAFGDIGDDAFILTLTAGPLHGEAVTQWRRTYKRRATSPDFMPFEGAYGSPSPQRPEQSVQFDFLIGEWNESQDMTFPNGQNAKWPSNGAAVHTLNGHGIMEFTWFDVDPNLPDAATTIVRIYNRVMRRWECMYVTNRFNSILYFGGIKQGDRIVLHSFNADNSGGQFSYWTFHDMAADSYGWFANTSRDRGQTFEKTWIIKGERKSSD